jgi:hypothetical protein
MVCFRAAGLSKDDAADDSGTELPVGVFEHAPVRITAGDGDPDLARRDAHLSADTQQLQANSFALGARPPGSGKSQSAEAGDEEISSGRQVQTELVGP